MNPEQKPFSSRFKTSWSGDFFIILSDNFALEHFITMIVRTPKKRIQADSSLENCLIAYICTKVVLFSNEKKWESNIFFIIWPCTI